MKSIIQNTKCYIYGLFDPRNLQLRYIGKTKNPIKERLYEHVLEARTAKKYNHRLYWINQLLSEDLEPAIEILEECTEDGWQEIEKAWIKECREKGLNLVNGTKGGDNPPLWPIGKKHTEETKRKQSIAIGKYYKKNKHPRKGKIRPKEETKKAIETKKKNGTFHKSLKDYLSEEKFRELYAKRDTQKWRDNLSKAAKRRLSKPENNPMYGKTQSEESKIKNRLSNLMYHANRKNDTEELYKLQEEYYQIAGRYNTKYQSRLSY